MASMFGCLAFCLVLVFYQTGDHGCVKVGRQHQSWTLSFFTAFRMTKMGLWLLLLLHAPTLTQP